MDNPISIKGSAVFIRLDKFSLPTNLHCHARNHHRPLKNLLQAQARWDGGSVSRDGPQAGPRSGHQGATGIVCSGQGTIGPIIATLRCHQNGRSADSILPHHGVTSFNQRVLRTGANCFPLREIECYQRLAPVAKLGICCRA